MLMMDVSSIRASSLALLMVIIFQEKQDLLKSCGEFFMLDACMEGRILWLYVDMQTPVR